MSTNSASCSRPPCCWPRVAGKPWPRTPTGAVVLERIFNDSFASILTVDNNYSPLISIDDECAGPLGWANMHAWRFSSDGTTPQEYCQHRRLHLHRRRDPERHR